MPYVRETACLTLAEAIADHTAATAEAALALTSGQAADVNIFDFSTDHLKSYTARTRENFAFVNALCQMRN